MHSRIYKGGNDIDQLALFNKGTKFACFSNPSRKEPNDIMNCYLQNKSSNEVALEETEKLDAS